MSDGGPVTLDRDPVAALVAELAAAPCTFGTSARGRHCTEVFLKPEDYCWPCRARQALAERSFATAGDRRRP